MVAIPISLLAGVMGVVRDPNKGPAILGTLISGVLILFWAVAISGVLWC